MNQVIFIGRTTKDVEMTTTTNGKSVARVTLAVNRKYKDQSGNKVTDFFNLVIWNKLAEICYKYVKKGNQILVKGELQNRSYETQDGQKRYITELIVEELEMLGSKQQGETQDYGEPVPPPENNRPELQEIDIGDDLPF